MKLVYLGSDEPDEDTVTTVFGVEFEKGKPLEVSAEVASRLDGHPLFKAVASSPAPTAAKGVGA